MLAADDNNGLLVVDAALPSYGGLAFEATNEGSSARDHLANEITFLSWTRVGIGIFTIGLSAVTFNSTRLGAMLGVSFIITAVAMILVGLMRYTDIADALQRGDTLFSNGNVLAIGVLLVLIVMMSVMMVLNSFLEHGQLQT